MTDLSEGCNHCDAEPGQPCDVVAVPHERHVKCSVLRCVWRYARVAYQSGPYELGYLTAAREITDGVASHAQAKERGLYRLESEHRIDWDRGYDACVCAYMLGHDIEQMIEQAMFEPSTMTTASVVFNLLEGWPRKLREDPRRPARVEVVPAPRPESDEHRLPSYHEMLDYLCTELGVPGAPSFWEAVAHVKRKLGREDRG